MSAHSERSEGPPARPSSHRQRCRRLHRDRTWLRPTSPAVVHPGPAQFVDAGHIEPRHSTPVARSTSWQRSSEPSLSVMIRNEPSGEHADYRLVSDDLGLELLGLRHGANESRSAPLSPAGKIPVSSRSSSSTLPARRGPRVRHITVRKPSLAPLHGGSQPRRPAAPTITRFVEKPLPDAP